jgi:hypothetical protein
MLPRTLREYYYTVLGDRGCEPGLPRRRGQRRQDMTRRRGSDSQPCRRWLRWLKPVSSILKLRCGSFSSTSKRRTDCSDDMDSDDVIMVVIGRCPWTQFHGAVAVGVLVILVAYWWSLNPDTWHLFVNSDWAGEGADYWGGGKFVIGAVDRSTLLKLRHSERRTEKKKRQTYWSCCTPQLLTILRKQYIGTILRVWTHMKTL